MYLDTEFHELTGRTKFSYFYYTSRERFRRSTLPNTRKSVLDNFTVKELAIPDDLRLIKHVNGALYYLRQLHFGIFDMTVHNLQNPS
jgi:hypothetical protein